MLLMLWKGPLHGIGVSYFYSLLFLSSAPPPPSSVIIIVPLSTNRATACNTCIEGCR